MLCGHWCVPRRPSPSHAVQRAAPSCAALSTGREEKEKEKGALTTVVGMLLWTERWWRRAVPAARYRPEGSSTQVSSIGQGNGKGQRASRRKPSTAPDSKTGDVATSDRAGDSGGGVAVAAMSNDLRMFGCLLRRVYEGGDAMLMDGGMPGSCSSLDQARLLYICVCKQ